MAVTSTMDASIGTASPASPASAAPPALTRGADGPHERMLAPGRPIYFAWPIDASRLAASGATMDASASSGAASLTSSAAPSSPWRLIAHLHGICYPPSYSCGKWLKAAASVGALVCPTGNARCGDSAIGPPSWEAPSWAELVTTMDADLERSIARVGAERPGSLRREGAILTGFSRGGYAAPVIARRHPGRWPYLVLIEASPPLSVASLRSAGVRAVALVAGELGTEITEMRKLEAALGPAGFEARLFVMPRVAHRYSDDIDRIMADALAFLVAHDPP